MTDENVRIEIRICSYHIGEICGIPTIYLTDPPIKGEPTCELIKKTRIDDRIIGHFKTNHQSCSLKDYPERNYKIKLDYFENLGYNINNERKE